MSYLPDDLPNNPFAKLCAATGALFLAWAGFENEMAASLRNHMQRQFRDPSKGISLACAIYGSMRMKAARDTMKRIALEHGFGPKALEFHASLFMHVGHIEDLRDKLAHQMAVKAHKEEDGWWAVTDLVTSRSFKSLKAYMFETDAVAHAAVDLRSASRVIGGFLSKGPRRSAPELPAWQYKPSMLKLLSQKTARALPVLQTPPEALQA